MVDEINEIILEKDYTPEIARKWSSDGRYEYVHKKYYIKCYFKIGGNKKETRHKYLCDESDETIKRCVDIQTDASHCGECNHSCSEGLTCQEGQCQ